MARSYVFISSELVTVDISPTETIQEQQVTASTVKFGVVFVIRFDLVSYANAEQTAITIGQLADRFDTWMSIPGVIAVVSVEGITPANMLQLGTEITVQSHSGKSTTTFNFGYPVAEFNIIQPFIDAVDRHVAILDAVEGE
jgi:hypothetical protein